MKLEEIKQKFENKSIQKRIDFIDEYDFNDNYSDYYFNFLYKNQNKSNYLYLSELIDLTSYLGFYDTKFFSKYKSYIFGNSHYIVKLSILDYYLDYYLQKENIKINFNEFLEIEKLLLKKERKIVKNQILINLMVFKDKQKDIYFSLLIKSLEDTTDYRSFIRIINNLNELSDRLELKKEQKDELIILIKKKDLGKAVIQSLESFIENKKAKSPLSVDKRRK